MKRQNLRTVALIVVTLTYLLIGAAVFGWLESDHEVKQREALELIELIVKRKYNISEDDFAVLTTTVIKSVPHKAGIQWKFSGAFYFATTVVTTIGYGHSTPATVAGRTFCMFYALIGIPLGLVMFQSIGERLNTFVGCALKFAKRCFNAKNPEVTQTNLVMVVSVLSTILMTSMAAVFAEYERWEYFDALYYCFITLTTIGFGDYVALQKESALQSKPEYVALSLIFILFGLSVVSSAVNLLVLKFLTLNTEDEKRDEQLRYTASLNPIQLEGDVITSGRKSPHNHHSSASLSHHHHHHHHHHHQRHDTNSFDGSSFSLRDLGEQDEFNNKEMNDKNYEDEDENENENENDEQQQRMSSPIRWIQCDDEDDTDQDHLSYRQCQHSHQHQHQHRNYHLNYQQHLHHRQQQQQHGQHHYKQQHKANTQHSHLSQHHPYPHHDLHNQHINTKQLKLLHDSDSIENLNNRVDDLETIGCDRDGDLQSPYTFNDDLEDEIELETNVDDEPISCTISPSSSSYRKSNRRLMTSHYGYSRHKDHHHVHHPEMDYRYPPPPHHHHHHHHHHHKPQKTTQSDEQQSLEGNHKRTLDLNLISTKRPSSDLSASSNNKTNDLYRQSRLSNSLRIEPSTDSSKNSPHSSQSMIAIVTQNNNTNIDQSRPSICEEISSLHKVQHQQIANSKDTHNQVKHQCRHRGSHDHQRDVQRPSSRHSRP